MADQRSNRRRMLLITGIAPVLLYAMGRALHLSEVNALLLTALAPFVWFP